MHVVGLDIGGANIKASDGAARSLSRALAVWRAPERLPGVLDEVLREFGDPDAVAVTMTAELADCFETKAEGVTCVLDAVGRAAGARRVAVWQTGGEFVTTEEARELTPLVAAANWHALATWAGRCAPSGAALLMDIGSTTCDVIPLRDGGPVPQGLTDRERLISGELVYSGVRRTPLSAVAHSVPFRDGYCPLAAETFASTLDVYLTLGDMDEDPADRETADGRPATRDAARRRLARMLCSDETEFSADDAQQMARFLADVQRQRIGGALERVLQQSAGTAGEGSREALVAVTIAGEGEFLARRVVAASPRLAHAGVISLRETLGREHSQAACAFALARLASERLPGT